MALLKSSLLEEMSEIRRPMVAGRCYTYYCWRMVGIDVDVESFVVGLSVWIEGSVREV